MEFDISYKGKKNNINIARSVDIKKNIKLVKNNSLYFIMNIANGAVVAIDFEIYNKLDNYLKGFKKVDEINEYVAKLEEMGFFENITYERQAYFHITDRCNLNCIGCYSDLGNRDNFKDMNIQDIKTIFQELKKHKVVQIIYSGGEPTLRKDISSILKMAKEEFCFTNILISNGSKRLGENILKHLDVLSLSIDDFKKDVNELGRKLNYANILYNIEKCKSIGVSVSGIITIHEKNVDKIATYFEISKEYELPISFSIFYPTRKPNRVDNEFILTDEGLQKVVESSFREMSNTIEGILSHDNIYCRDICEGGRTTISIDSYGNLNPCHMLPDIVLGNLLVDSEFAWENLEHFIENTFVADEECDKCQFKFFCGAGCRSRAYYYKSLQAKDPYCFMYKLYYDKLISEIPGN